MRRRNFIKGILGSAATWPLAARAQQPALPVIGYLTATSLGERPNLVAAFRRGLDEAGFVEGRNVAMEFREAEGQYDRLPALAADLVSRRAAVIVVTGPPAAALAAKSATATIPIVFSSGGDPITLGLVASFNRPGGNITGVSLFNVALVPKQLELISELVPKADVIAALVNPDNPNTETEERELEAAARALRLQIHVLRASAEKDFDPAFAAIASKDTPRPGDCSVGGCPQR
jgi:putative ABC transport system substrate-binding protein